VEFHQRVREEFLRLAGENPEHYLVLDARAAVGDLADEVGARVEALL
jgi:dTMP kinase